MNILKMQIAYVSDGSSITQLLESWKKGQKHLVGKNGEKSICLVLERNSPLFEVKTYEST